MKNKKGLKKGFKRSLQQIIRELDKKAARISEKKKKPAREDKDLEKKVKKKSENPGTKKSRKKDERSSDQYSGNFDPLHRQAAEYRPKLDYDRLFSYMGSGKDSYSQHVKALQFSSEESSTTNVLDGEQVDNIMKKKMLSSMLGGIPDYVDVGEEERYRTWKMFNKGEWWWKMRYLNNTFGARDMDRNDDSFYSL